LLLALFVGSNVKGVEGFAVVVGVVSLLFLLGGIRMKKPPDQMANAQTNWDRCWMCARCGNQWEEMP
jgi:hypothetical protein